MTYKTYQDKRGNLYRVLPKTISYVSKYFSVHILKKDADWVPVLDGYRDSKKAYADLDNLVKRFDLEEVSE